MDNKKVISNICKICKDSSSYIQRIKDVEWYTIKYSDVAKNTSDRNSYKIFDNVKQKKGIYIFYNKDTLDVLYVGECHTINTDRDLAKRMSQHFTATNTGGLIYKLSGGDIDKGTKLIQEFIKDVSLSYFTLDVDNQEILFLESFLIAMLKPKYNFMYEENEF